MNSERTLTVHSLSFIQTALLLIKQSHEPWRKENTMPTNQGSMFLFQIGITEQSSCVFYETLYGVPERAMAIFN